MAVLQASLQYAVGINMIKLIASDLDGTLLQNGAQELNPGTVQLIHELTKQGRIFVAASGRQYPNLKRLFAPVSDEIAFICENGSLVVYQDKILAKHIIPRTTGQEILNAMMEREGCEALLSGVNTCYIQPKDEAYMIHIRDVVKNTVTVVDDILKVEEPYLKISVYEKNGINNSEDYWNERFGKEVTVVTSGNLWLDTVPKGINKGTAMQDLFRELQVTPQETMAFGDHYNDVEMLQNVSYSFAMDNAQPGILDICNFHTDQVEKTLEEVLDGKYDNKLHANRTDMSHRKCSTGGKV
ncbi:MULTISPECIES: HAD family hydrolase [Robinsoniella]|uniref:HAD family hydrolase n=1 Tax=Robinsoniella TaxID=588605 RepID=UPI001FA78A8B|nr:MULTISPECIES: HAD family hydrolase [Robinsoniella]